MATDYLVPWINSAGGDGSRNSMTVLLGDGVTQNWSFNFSGGYINKTDVKAYTYEPTQAVFTAIDLTDPAKWLGPNQIKLTPAVPAGTYLVIYRDTDKTQPLVNFTTNSVLNEVNLDMMAEQAVFATAEMADRFNAVNASASDATVRSVTALNTANTALDNSEAAQSAAAAAVSTANTANSTAGTANSKADAAVSTANGIDGKAQSALDASAEAVSTANTAKSTADGIAGTAQSAVDTANAANSTAGTANSTANTAKSTADTAKSTADGLASSIATANTNASNAVSTANSALTAAGLASVGQCRFLYVSSTQCALQRYNGQYVIINGTPRSIPAAGVTISNAGMTASTLYFVYVYMNGSAMTLEAVTTAPAIDSTTGIRIKAGDATRTLVGMVYAGTGAIFRDNPASDIHVASWFNKRRRVVAVLVGTNMNFNNTSTAPIGSGGSILVWGGESLTVNHAVRLGNSTTGTLDVVQGMVNGSGTGTSAVYQAPSNNAQGDVFITGEYDTLGEGLALGRLGAYCTAGVGLIIVATEFLIANI